ncbi:MAG: DUF2339 domain-containing protein [Bacteroidota bacterium]
MSHDLMIIKQLLNKLDDLMKRQETFQGEIEDLRREIQNLESAERKPEPVLSDLPAGQTEMISGHEPLLQQEPGSHEGEPIQPVKETVHLPAEEKKTPKIRANIEKFIGENLINKIGIVITVIGVGIGAKYAIDHDLISPWTRIILGYLLGLGLMGFAFHLKKQYENFSAVLLSGSMAVLYFITFAACNFYDLIPPGLAFFLMALFTAFTVAAAIGYNQQLIAHLGLVGAYAVPFLLDDGSGKIVIMFSYMAIINAGILVISFRKYWKPLSYSSFLLTWLIFLTWFIHTYETAVHFQLAWIFLCIFFVTFYLILLAYRLLKKEKSGVENILLLLANSSVFYGVGYSILQQDIRSEGYLGLFTLINGLIHCGVSIIIYRQKQTDKNLFYFTVGLVIAYFTIAIPVQLDGNWVTMLWSAEAAVLFRIGRTKNSVVYELLSYPLMILAFFSVALGWPEAYNTLGRLQNDIRILPVFNINFLTSLLFIASFSGINILNSSKKFSSPFQTKTSLIHLLNFMMPAMLLIVLYFSFYMEIISVWNQLYNGSLVTAEKGISDLQEFHNADLLQYKTIAILIYSLLFFSLLSLVNIVKLKKSLLGLINIGFNAIAAGVFLTLGLFALGALRETYLSQTLAEYYYRGIFNIGIRYVSFLFVALMLVALYYYVRQEFLDTDFRREFDIFLHIVVLTIAGNELINWMDIFRPQQSYKLGLSILFGVYALLLIALGIWKHKLHLRIAAIVLFAATLVKLFIYDLGSLDTISKTIVFVVLGILLLIISFLYNKYKKLIFEDKDEG